MVNYRRNFVPGGTYFFTVALQDRNSNILVRYVELLQASFQTVKRVKPYKTIAYVIMPDHLHIIWGLPECDSDYAGRWRSIKSNFTRAIHGAGVVLTKTVRNEYNLWQKRYWEHTIKDEQDLSNHIAYIHYNPVKHGYVDRPLNWPHSSLHKYVREGLVDENWASEPVPVSDGMFGEQ